MWSGNIRESDVIGEVSLCCMCSRPLTRFSSLIDGVGPCCRMKVDAFVSRNIVDFMTTGGNGNWDSCGDDTEEDEQPDAGFNNDVEEEAVEDHEDEDEDEDEELEWDSESEAGSD